ncbi:MAG: tyrosine protein phosphatase [Candidatus Hydrogenedentes bacterium]|nr:tyrosine protein phosphatase [Candidatus Hydrogenedentota bacterium]
MSDLYWIDGPWPGRLAITPRPRGGDWLSDDLRNLHDAGIDSVVSLLTKAEESEFALRSEEALAAASGMRFYSLPIADRSVPESMHEVSDTLLRLEGELANGQNVAFHCRQSIGRAPMIAACVLALTGVDVQEAFQRISTARGIEVPETAEQADWAERFVRESVPHPR